MKINPSKLLPQAKSSLVKVEKPSLSVKEKRISVASSIKPIKVKSTDLTKEIGENKKTKDIDDVNNKLIKIEKFLKTDLLVSQKKSEVKRKEKEKSDFDKAEKQLEDPKSKKFKMPGISGPSLGFLDRLKRFLFFTALGWLVPKIIEFLPKLEGFANIIGGIYKFAEGLFGKLFDGFMSLVKFGGDLKDKTLGFIAQATGGDAKNFEDKFNQLEKTFNNFVNISIVAGVLSADIGLAAVDEYNKWNKKNKTPDGKTKPREGGKPPTGKPTVTEGRGGQKPTGKPKITGDVKPSWLNKLKGPFAALKGPFSRFARVAVPGLGAAVGAADAAARFKEGDKIGGSLASVSAALDAGTAISALTGIGLPIAGILGTISMGIDVVLLIRDILRVSKWIPDKLLGFYRGGRLVRRYQGGGTTRKGRPVGGTPRRTINVTRRKSLVKVIPSKSQPGKDVGGERQIKKLYPDPEQIIDPYSPGSGFDWSSWLKNSKPSERKKVPNPYKALTNTAKILKDIPLVGGIMGAAVDIALGQKPSRNVYQTIATGIGNLVDSLSDQKVNKSMSSLMSEIRGFADGGTVSSRELKETYNSVSSADLIAKVLEPTVGQKVNEAINSIQKELMLKGKKEKDKKNDPDDLDTTPGNIKVTSDSPDFWLLVTAALFENGKPDGGYQGAADVAQAIYNRVSLPGWPKSIREVILEPGQFQPVRKYGGESEWSKINSRESATTFAKKYKGYSGNIVDQIAASLLDSSKQESARTFVGPRDNFRAESFEIKNNDLDDSTEASRYGHTFGFEPGGANIGKFKKGGLKAAEINRQVVTGTVETPSTTPTKGAIGVILPRGNPQFTSKYGFRNGRMHRGHDYGVDANSPVLSAEDGTVSHIERSFGDWGDAIYVKDSKGNETVYGHVNIGNGISNGVKVKKGQTIATVKYWPKGAAGAKYPDNTHLHLERIESGKHIDPTAYVNSLQAPVKIGQSPGQTPGQASNPNIINASGMALGNLDEKIKNLKPGQKIVFDKVGSIQLGKDWLGGSQIKYYDPKGSPINEKDFEKSLESSEVLKKMTKNNMTVQNMQSGGIIGQSKPKIPIPNSFASYENYEGDMTIAIQPIYIRENSTPLSARETILAFPVLTGVNNNSDIGRYRG